MINTHYTYQVKTSFQQKQSGYKQPEFQASNKPLPTFTSFSPSFAAKDIPYKSLFKTGLKATPNPNLRSELEKDKSIYDIENAFTRITSFSRYLKEEMIGYITPAGEHWFEKALINMIYGTRLEKISETEFKSAAKDLWSVIAKGDSYWTSDDFLNYLNSMKPSAARNATIEAIKEIAMERKSRATQVAFGYSSDLKKVQRLLDHGCAYSGEPMQRTGGWPYQVTAEHLFPSYNGGNDTDCNFILATSKANDDRGNLSLVDFLKGKTRKRD